MTLSKLINLQKRRVVLVKVVDQPITIQENLKRVQMFVKPPKR